MLKPSCNFCEVAPTDVRNQVAMGQRRKGTRNMRRKKVVRMPALRAMTWNRERSMMKGTLSTMRTLPTTKKVCYCLVPVRFGMCIQHDFQQDIQGTVIWPAPQDTSTQDSL